MERRTIIRPGYDCRKECEHDPPGEHGICGDEWMYVVMDGPRAVSLLVLSADYPESVERPLPSPLKRPLASGLSTHLSDPNGRPCEFVEGGRCECDITFLGAQAFWNEHADPRGSEQPESFWLALEAQLPERELN